MALAVESLTSMPMIATRPCQKETPLIARFYQAGHGPHQDAKKFTMTGRPAID